MSTVGLRKTKLARRSSAEKWFFGFAIAGLLDSGYLAWARAFNSSLVCLTGGGCNAVSASPYAYILGIPLSYLGFAVYVLLVLGALLLRRLPANTTGAAAVSAGVLSLNLAGALFSAYLTWTSVTIIGATCNWCITSAVIMWILLPFSIRISAHITANQ